MPSGWKIEVQIPEYIKYTAPEMLENQIQPSSNIDNRTITISDFRWLSSDGQKRATEALLWYVLASRFLSQFPDEHPIHSGWNYKERKNVGLEEKVNARREKVFEALNNPRGKNPLKVATEKFRDRSRISLHNFNFPVRWFEPSNR